VLTTDVVVITTLLQILMMRNIVKHAHKYLQIFCKNNALTNVKYLSVWKKVCNFSVCEDPETRRRL